MGTSETARTYLAAFNGSSGSLASFNHIFDAKVVGLATSPDGSILYAGGDFGTVDGVSRPRIAAFSTSTGALLPWTASVNARINAITTRGNTVYIAGSFTRVGGVDVTYVASLDASTGATNAGFAPQVDNSVYDLKVSPDGTKLYLAGAFTSVNGDSTIHGAAAVDPVTGSTIDFPAAKQAIPPVTPSCTSQPKVVVTTADTVFFGDEGTGGGCFDGTWAANISDGSLKWRSACLGATQGIAVVGNLMYVGSHAHDCSTDMSRDPDAFPEVGWAKGLSRHLTSHDITTGNLGPWYPNTNGGPGGKGLGPRVLATDGSQLFVGGEFTNVNGEPQQGFARFSPTGSPASVPAQPATPRAIALPNGDVTVQVQVPLDLDDTDLAVQIFRDGGSAPVFTSAPQHTLFWRDPVVTFVDSGLALGSKHTYKARAIEVSDGAAGPLSPSSPNPTVSAATTKYQDAVDADSPTLFWRLNETTGPVAGDYSRGGNPGVYFPGTRTAGPSQAGDGSTSYVANGTSGSISSAASFDTPSTYSTEAWFSTTSTTGGKIIGFGDRQGAYDFNGNPAVSSNYDKHVYMTNDGRLVFGVYAGSTVTLATTTAYNDGQWHHVVATQGAAGMALYVDGARVAKNGQTTSQGYRGYWRVGGDNLNGWPLRPSSNFFTGNVADVAVYSSVLTLDQVRAHYAASGRTPTAAVVPTDDYGKAVYNSSPDSFWRLDETSGTTAADASNNGNGANLVGGVITGAAGALGAQGTAMTFNGSDGNVVSTAALTTPSSYALELWFTTTTTSGGKLMGFGNAATGNSSNYDKHIYMTNDGKLVFGVWTGSPNTVTSAKSYNDGQWHHLVAQQGADGMSLYVDDALVGTNSTATSQSYTGYWRVGGDSLGGWPNGPSSNYFAGTIDEVAIYSTTLSASTIDAHYLASGNVGPDTIAPTVRLTSPTDGASLPPGPVAVTADASDNRGVASVSLQVDSTTVGTTTTSPYSLSWTASGGSHSLVVTATDSAGNSTSSSPITVYVDSPDTTPPTTQITAPTEGAGVYGSTTVTATADDDRGLAQVSLLVDGTTFDTKTSGPFTWDVPLTAVGPHTLQTVAKDSAGNTGSSMVVHVSVAADTTDPVTTITSPAEGDSLYGLTTVTATASDDRSLASVSLLVDGTSVGSKTAAPFTWSVSLTAPGPHTLQTAATDATGNTGSSAQVHVTVAADTTPPSVPTGLSASSVTSTGATLSWSASTDDRSLAGYRVYRGGTDVSGLITATTWSDTGLTPGTAYSYKVRAEDAAGNQSADSDGLSVTAQPSIVTVFTDSFDGTSGPWSPAWTTDANAGVVDLAANTGRLQVNDTSGAFVRAALTGPSTVTDVDLLLNYTWSATGNKAYFDVWTRGSGGWANSYRPRNGYGVELTSSSRTVSLLKSVNGTQSTLSSVSNAQTLSTSKQWLRLQVKGSTVRFKIWADGAAEPAAWTSTATDSSVSGAGTTYLAVNRAGTNSGLKSVTVDDVAVTDVTG